MVAPNRIQITQRQDVSNILESDLPWSKLAGCRILVTGAAGFLGGYLIRTLLALYPSGRVDHPVNVIAVVRDVSKARARLIDVLDDPHLTFQSSDLNAIARIEVADCNYVLHAASQASPRFYGVDPVGTLLPNALGTAALLECLRSSADARGMLYVSSSEVYGDVRGSRLLNEEAFGVLNPTSIRACYAEGKRFGEALCAAWYHQCKQSTYIVRPFHTYGPGL